jgi:hypothetical protein
MKLLQRLNLLQFIITYLYKKPNSKVLNHITITTALYTKQMVYVTHNTSISMPKEFLSYSYIFHIIKKNDITLTHHCYLQAFCSATCTTRNQLYSMLPYTLASLLSIHVIIYSQHPYYPSTYHLFPDLQKESISIMPFYLKTNIM